MKRSGSTCRAKNERASKLYHEVAPWGGAYASIVKVETGLTSVNARLDQIQQESDVMHSFPDKVKSFVDDLLHLKPSRNQENR